MKVSVIIPNYNHAQYLKQRIDSVLYQTFQDFEIIIIDDASTDHSLEIIQYYQNEPKITCFIQNTQNSGTPFGSWQKGFELAKGEYIWIAESDDWADSRFLETTVQVLDKKNKTGLVFTDSFIADENGVLQGTWKEVKNQKFSNQKWNENYTRNGVEELLENLAIMMTINNMSACLIRKAALPNMAEIKGFKGAGDWLFCVLIALEYDLEYIATTLNYFRTHDKNITKENAKSGLLLIEDIKVYAILLFQLKKKKVNLQNVEPKILDRFLFKYVTTEKVSLSRKKMIAALMWNISPRFLLKFLWTLFKYRIKNTLLSR